MRVNKDKIDQMARVAGEEAFNSERRDYEVAMLPLIYYWCLRGASEHSRGIGDSGLPMDDYRDECWMSGAIHVNAAMTESETEETNA